MRGDAERQTNMLLAVTPDSFIPDDHPIRRIKPIVDAVLRRLSPLFDTMYSTEGRPSIPPEHLLKASLLIALYSIRSERQFCERLRYDLLFRTSTSQTSPSTPPRSPMVDVRRYPPCQDIRSPRPDGSMSCQIVRHQAAGTGERHPLGDSPLSSRPVSASRHRTDHTS